MTVRKMRVKDTDDVLAFFKTNNKKFIGREDNTIKYIDEKHGRIVGFFSFYPQKTLSAKTSVFCTHIVYHPEYIPYEAIYFLREFADGRMIYINCENDINLMKDLRELGLGYDSVSQLMVCDS